MTEREAWAAYQAAARVAEAAWEAAWKATGEAWEAYRAAEVAALKEAEPTGPAPLG